MTPEPFITEMAKTNGIVAKDADTRKESKNEFFYWLGYYNGQDSIMGLDPKFRMRYISQTKGDKL